MSKKNTMMNMIEINNKVIMYVNKCVNNDSILIRKVYYFAYFNKLKLVQYGKLT